MSRDSRALATAALLALAAILTTPRLAAMDIWILDAIQSFGACRASVLASRYDRAAQLVIGAVIVWAGVVRPPRLTDLTRIGGTLAGGLVFVELLKTGVERLRPRAVPAMLAGNSLPSGHIMSTTIVALLAWSLVRRTRASVFGRSMAGGLLTGAVALEAVSRVLRGSHWLSDVAPSVLLAVVWILGARVLLRQQRVRPAHAVAALAVVYALVYAVPASRLHVTSPMDAPRVVLGAFELATRRGDADDAATAAADDAIAATTLWSPGVAPDTIEAVVQAACDLRAGPCPHVRFIVNGWPSAPLELRCGGRWYRLRPPRGVLHAGRNHIVVVRAPAGRPETRQPAITVRSLALIAGGTPTETDGLRS